MADRAKSSDWGWGLIAWPAFFATVLASWAALFEMSRGVGWICSAASIAALPFGGFWSLFPMWAVMMLAMMLPTFVPALVAYRRLPPAVGAGPAGWGGLAAGYSAVWIIGSAGFAAVQSGALSSGLLDPAGVVNDRWLAVAILAVAGLWQLSPTKAACQNGCLSPMQYFLGHWRGGFVGGWRMGVDFGRVCVGCCWAIMGLAFVGGMTSLWFMGLATVFMVAEKLPEVGAPLRRPAGALLLLIAAALALPVGGEFWIENWSLS